jgi:hypothetical protein
MSVISATILLGSHPRTSQLTVSVWGERRSGVRGRGDHAYTAPQAGRVTSSQGGGRVRIGGIRAGTGGEVVPRWGTKGDGGSGEINPNSLW